MLSHSIIDHDIESGASLLLLSQDGWALHGGGKNCGNTVSLTESTLYVCGALKIDIEDAAGVSCDDVDGILSIFYWPHTTAAKTIRTRHVAVLEHAGGATFGAASAWVSVLNRWARCIPLTPPAPPSPTQLSSGAGTAGIFTGLLSSSLPMSILPTRRIRVFVNPNAGSGGGERVWARASQMFTDAGIIVDVIITRSVGEARANVAGTNPSVLHSLEGIIVVGGDGSLVEVVDGLLNRRDWKTYSKSLALGVLPAGSGNGLAVSLCVSAGYSFSVDNATWAIIKGASDSIDIASVFCAGEEESVSHITGSVVSLPAEASPSCESSSAFFSCESMSAGHESTSWVVGAAKSAMASPVSSPIASSSGDGDGGGGGVGGAGAIPFPSIDFDIEVSGSASGGNGGGSSTEAVAVSSSARAVHIPIGRNWGVRRWSFLSLEWALPADLDLESESLRCLGGARFDVYALVRVASLRRYRGRFSFVLASPETERESTTTESIDSASLPELHHLVPFNQTPPSSRHWKTTDGTFTFLWATNTSHQAVGVSTCATTRHDSGTWTVALMREPSQCSMLSALLSLDTKGSFAQVAGVEIFNVVAWRLEPEVAGVIGGKESIKHQGPGCIALDGERIPFGPVQAEIHKKLLRVYARQKYTGSGGAVAK